MAPGQSTTMLADSLAKTHAAHQRQHAAALLVVLGGVVLAAVVVVGEQEAPVALPRHAEGEVETARAEAAQPRAVLDRT